MTHEELQALTETYAVGALDGEELSEFSEHLLGCWECRRAVIEFDEVTADGAKGLEPLRPSSNVKLTLLARASGTAPALPKTDDGEGAEQAEEGTRRRKPASVALSLVAAAALAVSFFSWQTAEHRGQLLEAQRGDQDLLALVETAGVRSHSLAGTGASPSAAGRVFWSDTTIGLSMHGLSPIPKDSIYQLWSIVGDDKQSVGLFAVSDEGALRSTVALVTPVSNTVKAFALSVEPAGGSPAPTGSICALSSGED
jgi:anti-sigma-K factor RskA